MSAQLRHPSQDLSYPFLSAVAAIRQRARQYMQHCALPQGVHAAVETTLRLLDDALAIELSRTCRNYRRVYVVDDAVATAFGEACERYARVENSHVDRIAARIVKLGGTPDFTSAEMAALRESARTECESLEDRIEEDLIIECIAVESYTEMIQYLEDRDSITLQLLELILAVAKRHLGELARTREQLLLRNTAVAGAKA
jgi:bacterioferritin